MRVTLMIKALFSCYSLVLLQSVTATELTISAASSLTESFKDLADHYQKQTPTVKIKLNFAASGSLLQQINHGAPIDLFASADQDTMNQAEQKQLLLSKTRVNFTYNQLVLIAPKRYTFTLNSLSDLQNPQIERIAIGNPQSVPVGRYAQKALTKAQLHVPLKRKLIHAQNTRQVLNYVVREEVDAGIVYATDANTSKDKVDIALNISLDEPIAYPIAVIKNSHDVRAANAFIRYVRSKEGQAILGKYGFAEPQKQAK